MRHNTAILRQANTYPADCVPREHFEIVFATKHVRALPPVHRESGETTAAENALAPAIMHRSPNRPAYEGTAKIMFMMFKIAGNTRLHIFFRSLDKYIKYYNTCIPYNVQSENVSALSADACEVHVTFTDSDRFSSL